MSFGQFQGIEDWRDIISALQVEDRHQSWFTSDEERACELLCVRNADILLQVIEVEALERYQAAEAHLVRLIDQRYEREARQVRQRRE